MLRIFDPEKDFGTFSKWWKDRGEPELPKSALPQVGFINEGAACFLVQTDSVFGMIEFLVCSRENRSHQRLVLEVVKACIDQARTLGFRHVIAPVESKTVANMAVKRLGCVSLGQTNLLSKEL